MRIAFDRQKYDILRWNSFQPNNHDPLAQFNSFVATLRRAIRRHPSTTIVLCIGRDDQSCLHVAAVLLGGFLILEEQTGFDQVAAAFNSVDTGFDQKLAGFLQDSSVHDCWRALIHARRLGWMQLFRDMAMPTPIPSNDVSFMVDEQPELEEMLHYASPVNGDVHMVVPGKILCFPTPAVLQDDRLWTDEETAEGWMARRFSAAFFANLFADLGVEVAMCLHASAYDRAAFLAQGIEVEDLGADPAGPHMLRAIDRFLAVAAAAPGLVALQSGAEDGPGHLVALVLSYLTSRLGFEPESAVAWIAMAHPALLAPPGGPDRGPPGPVMPPIATVMEGDGRELPRAASASAGGVAAGGRWWLSAKARPAAPLAFRRVMSSPGRLPLLAV